MQGPHQGPQVERGQRPAAAPLIALICMQRAWTRASRWLIDALRSAASRNFRALASSSLLPVSVLVCIVPILTLLLPTNAQAFGIEAFDAGALAEGGVPATEAASHPVSLELGVDLEHSGALADGDLRDLSLELPPGLLENPTAVPICSQADFQTPRNSPWEESHSGESCPDNTQVGTVTLASSHGGGETRTFGLFNLAPPPGAPSELAVNAYGVPLIFVPEIRQADGGYGLTLRARNLSQLLSIASLHLSIWGTPWSLLHDDQRGNCLNEAEPGFGWAKCSTGRPAKFPPRAYLTLPASCEGPLSYVSRAVSWQGGSAEASAQTPALEDCDSLDFEPEAHTALINPRTSSPSGYRFEIAVDTAGVTTPSRRAPAPVRKAVVQLPEGVTINPSVGSGLGVCTPAQFAAETPTSPPGAGCPNESKIGDFTVKSPLVDRCLDGSIFLAAPYENPFGSLLAVYLVAKNIQRGFLVKVAGRARARPGHRAPHRHLRPPAPAALLPLRDPLPRRPAQPAGDAARLRRLLDRGRHHALGRPEAWSQHARSPLQIAAGIGGGALPAAGLAPFSPGGRRRLAQLAAPAPTPPSTCT